MQITVNSAATELADGATVADLVSSYTGRALGADGQPTDGSRLAMAVAIGDAIVPRAAWSAHRLQAGDRVDLVTAVQGG